MSRRAESFQRVPGSAVRDALLALGQGRGQRNIGAQPYVRLARSYCKEQMQLAQQPR